jgi:hypothetical protein
VLVLKECRKVIGNMPASSTRFQPKVGALVSVASRTWPGINKPGGVGKISAIIIQDGETLVDIEYVLGGKEKAVDLEFVKEHSFDEENHGRPARSRRSTFSENIEDPVKMRLNAKTKTSVKKNVLVNVSSNTSSSDSKDTTKRRKLSATTGSTRSNKATSINCSSPKEGKEGGNKSLKLNESQLLMNDGKARNGQNEKLENQPNDTVERPSPVSFVESSSHSEVTPSRLSGFLKNVYTDMSKKAATFVENVIGRNSSQSSTPSSPDSANSSLVINLDTE